ncbi:MAG: MBL fold metallo-hydrolase [Chloroflexota bacterium]|nr:MBL fold metallo-hydrolase [Chloroflexota bacterium]MDE2941705.1 MBL fold metallo-hydrolase [Chloroflexota bacterium]
MKLGNPIRVVDGVYQIRAIGARVTVVSSGGETLLVDAGMRGSSGLIASGMDALGISLDTVGSLVLTHHHPDHASGVTELVAGRRIAVMAHRLDAAVLAGRCVDSGPIRRTLVTRFAAPVLHTMSGGPIPVAVELEDGDQVPFPLPVRAIHLPGHTAGSIALYVPDRGLVIIGDSLQYRLGRRLSPPAAAVTEDPERALASLERLLGMDFDAICFSHFPPMRTGAKAELRVMLGEHRRISSAIEPPTGGLDAADGW